MITISKMNLDTSVFGVCGNDCVGKVAIKSLEDIGVDISNIKTLDDFTKVHNLYKSKHVFMNCYFVQK